MYFTRQHEREIQLEMRDLEEQEALYTSGGDGTGNMSSSSMQQYGWLNAAPSYQ